MSDLDQIRKRINEADDLRDRALTLDHLRDYVGTCLNLGQRPWFGGRREGLGFADEQGKRSHFIEWHCLTHDEMVAFRDFLASEVHTYRKRADEIDREILAATSPEAAKGGEE